MRALNCDCKVLENIRLNESICLLKAQWTDKDHCPKAGQFYMLRCWKQDEAPLLSRPISVHEWDAETQTISFLYEVRGEKGTHKIAALKTGELLNLTGPAGNGWPVEQLLGKKVALVGGGIGTAPPLSACKRTCRQRGEAQLFRRFSG